MKNLSEYVLGRLMAGMLVVAPIYLAVLLLLKGMKSLTGVLKPFAHLLPNWLPAEKVLSLLMVLVICFLVGLAVRTRIGFALRNRLEKSFFERMPGYSLIRSLTLRLAGEAIGHTAGLRRWIWSGSPAHRGRFFHQHRRRQNRGDLDRLERSFQPRALRRQGLP